MNHEIVPSHAGVDNAKASPLYSFLLKEAGLGETLPDSSIVFQDCCWGKLAILENLTLYGNHSDSNRGNELYKDQNIAALC